MLAYVVVLLTVLDFCVPLYHHQFAVYVPGGSEKAHELAHRHGFINHGEVSVDRMARTRDLSLFFFYYFCEFLSNAEGEKAHCMDIINEPLGVNVNIFLFDVFIRSVFFSDKLPQLSFVRE